MSLPTNPNLLMAGGTSPYFNIQRSLRFRSSASAYLSRTPGSAGNRKTWTWSAWVKRGTLGATQVLFIGYVDADNKTRIDISSTDILRVYDITGGSTERVKVYTTQVLRDPGSWYHIVVALDTTSATSTITGSSTDRVRLYINGVQVTAFSSTVAPSQNADLYVDATNAHNVGGSVPDALYLDGYLAEVNFIDGQALTPSSFGYTDPYTGVWMPEKYNGTYGTNGFYLPFTNTTNTTNLCLDASGNGNNWTPNNISLTAGVTYDSMLDVPTNWGDGGNGRGNYAVLNPLWKGANITPTNGNLTNPLSSGSPNVAMSTLPMSAGKWYAEMTNTSAYSDVGLCILAANLTAPTFVIGVNTQAGLWEVYDNGAGVYVTSDGASFTSSLGASRFLSAGTIQFAYDATNGFFWIGKNNTWYDSSFGTTGNPSIGSNPTFTISNSRGPFNIGAGSNSATNSQYWNFGQRPFTYTPPSGFKTLNTLNLPTPTILNGAKYMAAVTYSGTSASNTVVATASNSGNNPYAVAFQPDLVWIKSRSAATDNKLTDSVRGVTKALISNTTGAETTDANGLTAFTSSGFTVGSDSVYNNGTGPATYVAWEWQAGKGSTSSNTSGSITSTVSVNQTAGFSIVTYTGTGANATVGHGLGVAPKMVIVKDRTSGARTSDQWPVYHSILGATQQLYLNSTAAASAASTVFNNTAPTSSVFSVGTWGGINFSGDNYVAYCFAEVSGYSKFGSYTGNASTDGTFVYTGFRPRYIMFKRTDVANNWGIYDTARSTYNAAAADLYADLSQQEFTSVAFDILSNGFKLRSTSAFCNASGGTYIYAAFAENPFNYSRAR